MTSLTDFAGESSGPTTVMPGPLDMQAVLPELTSPQERYDNGFRRGYMAGYAEGARQAKAEMAADLASQKAAWASYQARSAQLLSRLATATEEYVATYGPREAQLTDELLATAFALAEAIVGHEVSTRPGGYLALAAKALAELPLGPATVHAHPDDAPDLESAASSLSTGLRRVSVVADPAVGRGGCIVTSGATKVDARLVVALERARLAFCTGELDRSLVDSGSAAGANSDR